MPSSHKSKSTWLSDYCYSHGLSELWKVKDNNDVFVLHCIHPPPKAKNAIDLGLGGRKRRITRNIWGFLEVKTYPFKKYHPATFVKPERWRSMERQGSSVTPHWPPLPSSEDVWFHKKYNANACLSFLNYNSTLVMLAKEGWQLSPWLNQNVLGTSQQKVS